MKKLGLIAVVILVATGAATANEKETGTEPELSEHMAHVMDEGAKSDYNLVQIMHDLSFQLNRIEFGILTNNRYMIEAGARAITSHPVPKGGLKPYLKKNAADIKAAAPSIDEDIHKAALEIAKNAKTASMAELQDKANGITKSCIGCHEMFRNVQ
ncbi:MAG: cytochrome c [Nitrospinae bacterium]|nr:cytochrome c [Nitrospinota bacterium]